MKLVLAMFILLILTACGSPSSTRSPAQLRADATAAVLRAQADGLQAVQAANEMERAERDATAMAMNARNTAVAFGVTATWEARPTATPTPEPTGTPLPTSTSTRASTVAPTMEPSRAVVVVEVTATAQPIAAVTAQPMVTPLAGAIGSIVVSLILLLIVLRVLKLMQTNGD